MKSEPDQFGISDLQRVKIEPWTGVRNYMARNHMRAMTVGDEVLFHHSNSTPPGVAGLARVVKTGVVDATQFDPDSKYHDPKAKPEAPTWDCVEVEYVDTFPYLVSMDRMRAEVALSAMLVLQRGMRLSVQPVSKAHYDRVVKLGREAPKPSAKRPATKQRSAKPPAKKPARPARAR
ncbi:MAG TPA: EVE domain-containing protein [Kofleriaceae bacterium]